MILTKIVITKIVINILQKNSDDERYLQKALKKAIFENFIIIHYFNIILILHNLKFQIPTACGLIKSEV